MYLFPSHHLGSQAVLLDQASIHMPFFQSSALHVALNVVCPGGTKCRLSDCFVAHNHSTHRDNSSFPVTLIFHPTPMETFLSLASYTVPMIPSICLRNSTSSSILQPRGHNTEFYSFLSVYLSGCLPVCLSHSVFLFVSLRLPPSLPPQVWL